MERIVKRRTPDYQYMQAVVAALRGKYPVAHATVCGRSLCGRSIYAFTIGEGDGPAVYTAGYHGQEWLTTLVLLRFLEELCYALTNGKELAGVPVAPALEGHSAVFLPCVNPDGVEIALHGPRAAGKYQQLVERAMRGSVEKWNANARGVDINHNFDAGWLTTRRMEREMGVTGPAPRRYGGERAESEPETAAVTGACRQTDARSLLCLHSQGEEIYWQYGEHTPQRSSMMARILSASSGYRLAQPAPISSHGGAKDWFIAEMNRPGFTIEIGRGTNPLPIESFESIYLRLREMLMLFLLM